MWTQEELLLMPLLYIHPISKHSYLPSDKHFCWWINYNESQYLHTKYLCKQDSFHHRYNIDPHEWPSHSLVLTIPWSYNIMSLPHLSKHSGRWIGNLLPHVCLYFSINSYRLHSEWSNKPLDLLPALANYFHISMIQNLGLALQPLNWCFCRYYYSRCIYGLTNSDKPICWTFYSHKALTRWHKCRLACILNLWIDLIDHDQKIT